MEQIHTTMKSSVSLLTGTFLINKTASLLNFLKNSDFILWKLLQNLIGTKSKRTLETASKEQNA